jgi:iturin family lipopeptide synthetase A
MNSHTGENHAEMLSSSQRLLFVLQQAKTQLQAVEYQKHEPIAIIGMGCRFPGKANNPEAYWHLLQAGVDAITAIPSNRWDINTFYDHNPDTPGKMYTKYGAFLEEVDGFEPKFFNISPREAIAIDPQQRLLLEVSWEALENAGQATQQLQGSKTGIFIGIGSEDYSQLTINSGDFTRIDPHSSLGNARSIAAGRLAYIFGFQGPCLQLDTSCSSSLLAVHLACQSLRAKESNLALAGGVNLILSPETSIGLCKLKALSVDGHCKTFDAAADGYARGEGCGIIVLKRLSDVIADRDNILAIIRGSAVNHDGRSNGMTAPNGSAQEALIREALDNAKVEPNQVQYVEAHGTGTPLGDPIEVFALEKVLCQGRLEDNPLTIGSVKTNIGHLEAAAGIASLIKVVLSLQHQQIPPHLHFHKPNPYIPWERLPIVVPRQLTPWSTQEPRLAGVSAFGMSGTNVHLILEEAPKIEPVYLEAERPFHLLCLSARSEKALHTLAGLYQSYIQSHPQVALGDVCFTANTGRSHFEYRLAVVAQSTEQMAEKLTGFITRTDTNGLVRGQVNSINRPKIAWLFTGQGSQYIGMGRQLYETQPTFRQAIDRCDQILSSYLEKPLLEILYPANNESSPLNETAYTQPAIFSLEYALAELWRSWGITPDLVMGHSVGEYVAACVAGVFSLEDGLKLIVHRSQLMQSLPSNGAMVVVFADADIVSKTLAEYHRKIHLAAVNGVQNIVISGDKEAVESAVKQFKSQGITVQYLQVSHAFHSPLMEPILDEFECQARQVQFQAPHIGLISNLTGQIFSAEEIPDANYWRCHLRQTVQFATGINTLHNLGCNIFLEIGPRTTLISMGKKCLSQAKHSWIPSLQPEQEDWQVLLNSLGKLAVLGVEINWTECDRHYQRRRLSLPTYPFERQRYWYEFDDKHKNENFMNVQKLDIPLTQAEVDLSTINTHQEIILPKLRVLIAELLHIETSKINIHEPFLEMGADSLVLMEAVRTIENAFGIKVAIRQFFEECTTIDSLSTYIDKNISPEWVLKNSPQPKPELDGSSPKSASQIATSLTTDTVQPKIAPPVAPQKIIPSSINENGIVNNKQTIAVSETALERIIGQQLEVMTHLNASQHELMRQQLEVLRNNPLSIGTSLEPHSKSQSNGKIDTHQLQIAPEQSVPTPSYPKNAASIQPQANLDPARVNGKLSLQQQQHLTALIANYTQKTQASKQRAQSDRSFLADSRAVAGFRPSTKEMVYPIIGERAQGARCWDIDGNEYVDLTMGFGVLLFGHAAPFITAAVEKHLQQGIQIGPQANYAGEVATLISELTGMERVCFCNSGTEAVMTALRLARTKTGRTKIAIFAGAYHGHFDGILAKESLDGLSTVPLAPGITANAVADVLVLDYGELQSLEILQAHASELAAVLVEPVQGRRPDLQPREFLQQLRQLTTTAGIALIFDEVLLGFRIHLGGAQAWFGIEADIATYGKIVGGGIPIGVVAGKASYMNGIDGGLWNYGDASYPQAEKTFFAGTFNKNHLGMAVARAVLQHLKSQGTKLQAQLNQRTSYLATTLNSYFEQEGIPIRIVYFGSMFSFAFSGNFDLLFYHLLSKGVYIWEGRNCFLSTAHTDTDIEFVIQAFKISVEELQTAGFFPSSASGELKTLNNLSLTTSLVESAKLESINIEAPVLNKQIDKLTQSNPNQQQGFWERSQYKPSLTTNKVPEIKFSQNSNKTIEFSLFYFGQYDSEFVSDKYNLLFEGAKFADEHGFTALWVPERHFHAFGGFSPNPSVISAALAKVTQRIQLRAGSVVLPIHHPIRVAEEWSVVDNLSQGRVGISFASGWHPNDFVFAPDAYGKHRDLMFQEIATVQKLWRGEPIQFRDGAGKDINIKLFPMPVQPDVPIWITIVNNPETYIKAGEIGVGVLTNLMGQTVEDLAKNIKLYRESLYQHGHDPKSGHVTVLLHTFVGEDINIVREKAHQPFCKYLQSSIGLLQNLVKSQGLNINFETLTEDDKNYLLSVAYERYVQTSALIGTPDSCSKIIDNMMAIGVDEVACLIDFGVDADSVLQSLSYLNLLRERYEVQNTSELISTLPNQIVSEAPLTQAQKQLWLLAQIGEDESNAYNESIMLQLQGCLHLPAMRSAFKKLVARHEALRTIIDSSGEIQRVLSDIIIEVPLIDLSNIDASDRQTKIDEWLKQENQQSFDLTRGPLLRINLLKLEEELHLLIITAHHIIIDAWSIGLMLQEVGAFYSAECQGKVFQPEAPLQFKEYIHWQLSQSQSAEIAKQQAYWLGKFVDSVPILELPTDRRRSPVMSYKGARVSMKANASLYAALKEFSKKNGCTLFMTLLAGYMTLLHRLSNQDEIIVGIPVAGRGLAGSEKVVGYCAHLLPICSYIDGSPTFLEYLANIKHILLDSYENQDFTFAQLLEQLNLPRDPSRSPLVNVTFNLDRPQVVPTMLGLELSLVPYPKGYVQYDIDLNVIEFGNELVMEVDYSTDLFDAATITRMTGHFQTLLEGIVAHPEQRIAELPILTAPERQQLLFEWNDTHTEYPQHQCIHQLFESQVERTPDAVAVVFAEQQLTYRELNSRANQLAHYLRSLGVQKEVLVGLCLERSLEQLISILAILKAGGAYLPLDPTYPQQRLSYLLADAQVKIVLTQQSLIVILPTELEQVICWDRDAQKIVHQAVTTLNNVAAPENVAAVFYTSGSTGTPKGVVMTHQGLVNYGLAALSSLELNYTDRFLQLASSSFDVFLEEILPTWLAGAVVVLPHEQNPLTATQLHQVISQQQVTVMELTTAHWHEWVSQLVSFATSPPSSLRLVLVGGETILPEQLHHWQQFGLPLVHVYGLTETTITSTMYQLPPDSRITALGYRLPIGRPLANTFMYVLDEQLQPVPVGVPGEMYIGGAGLSRGYLHRPQLTAERFVSNPWASFSGERLYKTGDIGRYLADGNIEFWGRRDEQVKIRGFRIELAEVEAVLSQHPSVQQTVVIAREDVPGNKRLVAYLVTHPEQTPTITQLRQFFKEKLPEYMIPGAFVFLDTLPLTPNGKVDRRSLPAPQTSGELEVSFVAPRTPIEQMLADIWAEVLVQEQVGINDNFFELGGHSLLATQLISRVRNIFQVELPVRSLFEAATIGEFSQYIQQFQQQLQQPAPPLLAVARDGELPLSFAQQRLWFFNQLEPESAAYNVPGAIRLQGQLNVAALAQSLQEIVRRHEALRTNFTSLDGQAVQIIHPPGDWQLTVLDWQHLSAPEQEHQTQQLATNEAERPFDLATEPLLRVTLLVLSQQEHILMLCMHHIVSDGWSIGVLVQEIVTLYSAYCQGQPSPLPELSIQYADFARWQRQWLQGQVLESQLDYWQTQLAFAPALLELPTDRPRPAVQSFRGGQQSFTLTPDLTSALNHLSRKQGVTLFMTLLAALDTLLYRYTGQVDILVGSPIANRNHSEIECLIGFFVNTLVLRTDISGNPSFGELLTRVREMTLAAYAHQDLPFELLVEALQPERNLSHTPLFQVMFALDNTPLSEMELPGLTLSPWATENSTAAFDLILSMQETAEGLVGEWEYNSDLFDAATITRMTGHFQTLLEGIVAHPKQRIAELPILTAPERQQLLFEWNDTHTEYPQHQCIHQLFESQVERTPDAVAVVFAEQQLTYRELNSRANQLAHYLRSLGVITEVLVGICVERSLEMVVGLLGILKTGGAYVPLDPEYPQERLSFMLADTQVQVVLTQQRLVERLPKHEAQVICLDEAWEQIAQHNHENLVSGVTPSDLADVIYTSGSTGIPKGVMVTHFGLYNLAQAQIQLFDLVSSSRILQFASISFDASIWEIIMALGSGATLYLSTKDSLFPGSGLIQLLRDYGITHITLPPSALAVMPVQELPALQTMIVAGEACSVDLISQWSVGRRFFNAYGPTEATVCATVAQWALTDRKLTIGRPIANTQVYILDSYLQPVPVGVLGELHIGGVGLAQGYLNRSELTNEKFIPNPFSNDPEETRLYKTGDLARYLADGNIEYLGRIDNQVKIRGFRIELAEVEAVLSQHPSVQQTVVIAREDVPGNKRLVAYLVTHPEQTPTITQLRQFFKEKLPEYMIPGAFVFLDTLPLTPNGKVDRRSLPAPDTSHRSLETGFVAPRTPTEEIVASIWSEVLGLQRLSIHDKFFELGGHSLLATQVISRLREVFSIDLPLRSLFETPTVEGMCQAINVMGKADTFDAIEVSAATDLNAEAVLDPSICPKNLPIEYVTEPNYILLTGSTGFLGAFLLHELLEQTQADIYCLVRSSNVKEAKKKIENNLKSYLLWNEYFSSRIISIVGDLSQPLLGLSFEQFQIMASKIDIIYHNGALVNSISPYSTLKATNVLGTQEVLRLATQIKVKPVHFISSLSVFSSNSYSQESVILEQDNLERSEGLDGYGQSKWVAEKLVMIARSRGLPVCIYRPGSISGHSQTGAGQTNNFTWMLIKGCIQLGSIPDLDIMVDLTPVDYVSKGIVHLSKQPESLTKAFHLVNAHPIHLSKLIEWIKCFGYQLEQISYEKWRAELMNVTNSSSENALYPLVHLFDEEISEQQMPDQTKQRQFDCQNTLNGLVGTSIICSTVNAELLSTYFSYFISSGYLSVPSPMTGLG